MLPCIKAESRLCIDDITMSCMLWFLLISEDCRPEMTTRITNYLHAFLFLVIVMHSAIDSRPVFHIIYQAPSFACRSAATDLRQVE